ncbi:MAG: hypothetical protein WCK32_08245 [Chlorobiaceae bacterium]
MSKHDGKVSISYKQGLNAQEPSGFKLCSVTLDQLAEMVRSAGQYAATAFNNGYRDARHALPGAELIILDYDNGITLAEAKTLFSQYMGMIATTRNHQKEKHGVICDRFRVILPARKPVMLDGAAFSAMMKEVIAHYGADRACSDISRMYFGHPDSEVVFLDGWKLFDWQPFYNSAQDKERQRTHQKRTFTQRSSGDRKAAQLDKAIQTFMQNNFVIGARNDTLYKVAHWLHDEQIDDVAGRIAALNSQSGCPLPDDEVNRIIKGVQTTKKQTTMKRTETA